MIIKRPKIRQYNVKSYQHKSSVYWAIIIIWSLLEVFGGFPLYAQSFRVGYLNHNFAFVLLLLNALFISYFWLNGIKDLVYVPVFYHNQKKRIAREQYIEAHYYYTKKYPRVVLCYTTCDDFVPDSLYQSMHQIYPNYKVVILDDSRNKSYKEKVNEFALKYHIPVIRRHKHLFFKAGNLNHYLMHHTDWDYFIPLDSDEIIPRNFISKALSFFLWDPKLGILQCNHISTRNYNKFMNEYARGASAHWPVYQSVKERFGFLSMLGHGAMISRRCLYDIGGFPHMVAEDISATIEATFHNWHTRFAETITCQEQFPLDYLGFRKRLDKWCSGNMQFTKRYSKPILKSHQLKWYQKLDILLFVYSLPLNYVFSIFLFLNITLMPICNIAPNYPLWLIIPTIILFFSPMINDMIYNVQHGLSFLKQCRYSWDSILLYGGMYFPTIYTAIKLLFGMKPKFTVTPKQGHKYTLGESIYANIKVLLFALLISLDSLFFCHSLSPVILIILPAICSVNLTLMSNRKK